MTSSTKCRAEGGVAKCKRANCPEKRAQAAERAAFFAHPSQGKRAVVPAVTEESDRKFTLDELEADETFKSEFDAAVEDATDLWAEDWNSHDAADSAWTNLYYAFGVDGTNRQALVNENEAHFKRMLREAVSDSHRERAR